MVKYDAMQVCVNGHYITDRYHSQPEYREKHCSKCGSETIKECQECGTEIDGKDLDSSVVVVSTSTPSPPDHCDNCGTPFPWTQQPDGDELIDVQTAINNGESETIEFKEEVSNPRKISKEIVALANQKGGLLLIGVTDDGIVVGVDDIDAVEERVFGHIRATIDPAMNPDVRKMRVDGDDILAVQAPEAEEKPYNLDGTFYIRTGTGTDKLSTDELGRWYG
jgi:hypothetical protein